MARRLKTLAKEINKIEGYTAEIVEGYCNTDRHISGTRYRFQGKGRYGNKLIVKDKKGNIIFTHNAAETYRHNEEVERWLEYLLEHGKPYVPFGDN